MNARQRRYKRRHPSLMDIMAKAIREEIDKEILEKLASHMETYFSHLSTVEGIAPNTKKVSNQGIL